MWRGTCGGWGVFLLSPDVAGDVWGVGGVSVES